VFRVTVLTIFPDLFPGALGFGLSGKGLGSIWDLHIINIRDFAKDKHKKVDDTPYGGGAGMVMRPDVVHDALTHALGLYHPHIPTILFMSPRGQVFSQNMAVSLMGNNSGPLVTNSSKSVLMEGETARRTAVYLSVYEDSSTESTQQKADYKELRERSSDGMIILCGRYEGIDQRVIDIWKTEHGMLEVSIGDFVLFGGELPAMIVIDACIRQITGIMNNPDSTKIESFSVDLLEYPQYTKPSTWRGESVPEVLLSGNHGEIERWRLEQSEEITKELRPDLWGRYRSNPDG
jgi:tRNA (guanine37-N1)-methyltransferase